VEDVASGEVCCFFRGGDRVRVDDSYREIIAEVDSWTSEELVEAIYEDASDLEMVGAVFRLGIGAPPEFSDEYFDAFSTALRHESPMVRAAAVRTTSYMEWPGLLRDLRAVAVNDTDERVQREAAKVIEAFERVGVRDV
jgi:hypothetical protein